MSSVGERFRNNLGQLSISQTSIETLSKYAQFHADDARAIADVWWQEFSRSDPSKRLAFVYLLSDIAHAFKGRINPFIVEFEPLLTYIVDGILCKCTPEAQSRVVRTLKVWRQRQIFNSNLIADLLVRFETDDVAKPPTPSLIEALKQQDAEALNDVLAAASAATFLSNPSLQGEQQIRVYEARLESRRRRTQELITLLSDRLAAEKASLSTCLADLADCRSKLELQDPAPSKRARI